MQLLTGISSTAVWPHSGHAIETLDGIDRILPSPTADSGTPSRDEHSGASSGPRPSLHDDLHVTAK